MSDAYVIIGIHGLANKPKEETLAKGWQDSIREGLERNQRRSAEAVSFDLVYWRDWRYPEPIPDAENDEPYLRADGSQPLPAYEDGWFDDVVARLGNLVGEPLDWAKRYFGVDEVADTVLRTRLKDLATYYEEPEKRDLLRQRMKDKLAKHAGKRIMVIAHSMGSIIAYDVLRAMGREDPQFRVEHFVTIGSPLGLPHVKHRIYQENDLVRTPSVVRQWTNLADRRDPVAADVHLADDYRANSRGVRVVDDLVINGYVGHERKPNHHKSYGYLRTPEVSRVVRSFI